MKVYARDVIDAIMHTEYRLPTSEKLVSMLNQQNLNGMQVAVQRYADFVTGDLNSFLLFVRGAGIRTVMFSFLYYTQDEIDEMFTLSDSDKALFFSPYHDFGSQVYKGRLPRRDTGEVFSGYAVYLNYSKFLRAQLDLYHPKELRMYVVHEGRVIAFQQADLWMLRMNFIDRNAIRQYAMQNNIGANSLMFEFD